MFTGPTSKRLFKTWSKPHLIEGLLYPPSSRDSVRPLSLFSAANNSNLTPGLLEHLACIAPYAVTDPSQISCTSKRCHYFFRTRSEVAILFPCACLFRLFGPSRVPLGISVSNTQDRAAARGLIHFAAPAESTRMETTSAAPRSVSICHPSEFVHGETKSEAEYEMA
jgi:hypothetical protein